MIQWSLSIKDTSNKGLLSNEDNVRCPSHIELYPNLPLNKGDLSIQDSQLGPSGVHYREVPLYLLYISLCWLVTSPFFTSAPSLYVHT